MQTPNTPRRESIMKRRSRRLLEHGLQVAVVAWRDFNKARLPVLALLHAIPNGAGLKHTVKRHLDGSKTRYSQEGHRLRKEGLTSGIPDMSLPAPRGPYHGLYIEHKYGDNSLSKEQRDIASKLASEGYYVEVSKDALTSIALIEAYLALGPYDPRSAGLSEPTLGKKRRPVQLPGSSLAPAGSRKR